MSMASKKKKIAVFANFIISISIAMLAYITFSTTLQYWILKIPIPGEVIAILAGAWAGELVTIAARQVFGSDVVMKKYAKNNEDDLP